MDNGYNIIIVEDDKAAGKVIAYQLKEQGYHPYHFERAEEALLFFQQNPVDLVLLDYKLPGMSGEEAITGLQAIKPDVRILLSSGYSEHDAERRLAGGGPIAFIQKPYTLRALRQKVRELLGG